MAGSETFDVIVVGGGAAGCVVAARLAESGSRSVLLLEAGPDLRAEPPGRSRDGWHMTRDFDWGYASEPKEFGDVQKLRRVKLLGGTSSIVRFALRGSPADYGEWEALGNTAWGFEDVLPYLRRLEADLDFGDEPWHGANGPIPVTRYADIERTDVHLASLEALERVGFPAIEDHNRPGAVGFGPMPMSSRDGRRITTASAYLPYGQTPANLTIRPDSQVAEVMFEGRRAVGVRLAGRRHHRRALCGAQRRNLRESADPDAFGDRAGRAPSGGRRCDPRRPPWRRSEPRRPPERRDRLRLPGIGAHDAPSAHCRNVPQLDGRDARTPGPDAVDLRAVLEPGWPADLRDRPGPAQAPLEGPRHVCARPTRRIRRGSSYRCPTRSMSSAWQRRIAAAGKWRPTRR